MSFVLLGFATFGMSYMLFYTHGPYGIFLAARRTISGTEQVGVYDDDENLVDIIEEPGNGFGADLLSCFWCFSFWVNIIVCIMYFIATGFGDTWIFILLAAYGVSGTLHEITNG